VGGAAEPILEGLNPFLDEQQDEVELVETKFINDMVAQSGRHSFIFTSMGTPDATTILLSPSHAFGSGDHPSTGLAIEFLQGLAPLHDAVLDVGCGTGVLSFVALRLGAGRVLGVDIDEEGVRGARVNSSLNQLEDRAEFTSLPLAKVTGSFPLILANLTCSVLKYLLSDLTALAEGNGRLVVSGLQGRQGTEAEEFLTEYGWRVAERKSAGKWQALLAEQDGSKITS
jgi:ribosomal protein L11 methyltransferase